MKLFTKSIQSGIFEVYREKDYKNISGIGHVMDGVVFPDGTTVIRWRKKYGSTSIFKSFSQFKRVHLKNHEGDIKWLQQNS